MCDKDRRDTVYIHYIFSKAADYRQFITIWCWEMPFLFSAPFLYLMHGVEKLGELIETLPVLAGVFLALHNGFPQFLDVRHPNVIEYGLALQAVLWHCKRGTRCQHVGQKQGQRTNPNRNKVLLHFIYTEPGKQWNVQFLLKLTSCRIMSCNPTSEVSEDWPVLSSNRTFMHRYSSWETWSRTNSLEIFSISSHWSVM